MNGPSVSPADRFRRDELVWSLSRLTTLINVGRVPLPDRMIAPVVIEFTVPSAGVDQAAEAIGRTPQRFKDEYFVVLDGDELRIRWSAHAPADPTGLDYSREADDPTPVSPARVPLHIGAMTERGLVEP